MSRSALLQSGIRPSSTGWPWLRGRPRAGPWPPRQHHDRSRPAGSPSRPRRGPGGDRGGCDRGAFHVDLAVDQRSDGRGRTDGATRHPRGVSPPQCVRAHLQRPRPSGHPPAVLAASPPASGYSLRRLVGDLLARRRPSHRRRGGPGALWAGSTHGRGPIPAVLLVADHAAVCGVSLGGGLAEPAPGPASPDPRGQPGLSAAVHRRCLLSSPGPPAHLDVAGQSRLVAVELPALRRRRRAGGIALPGPLGVAAQPFTFGRPGRRRHRGRGLGRLPDRRPSGGHDPPSGPVRCFSPLWSSRAWFSPGRR